MADIRAALAPSRSGFTPGRIGVMRALNRHVERVFNPFGKIIIGESGG
jgi:hypothetical protein